MVSLLNKINYTHSCELIYLKSPARVWRPRPAETRREYCYAVSDSKGLSTVSTTDFGPPAPIAASTIGAIVSMPPPAFNSFPNVHRSTPLVLYRCEISGGKPLEVFHKRPPVVIFVCCANILSYQSMCNFV